MQWCSSRPALARLIWGILKQKVAARTKREGCEETYFRHTAGTCVSKVVHGASAGSDDGAHTPQGSNYAPLLSWSLRPRRRGPGQNATGASLLSQTRYEEPRRAGAGTPHSLASAHSSLKQKNPQLSRATTNDGAT